MTRRRGPAPAIEFKMTLLGSEPPIWRRFAVRQDLTLTQLHDVIQVVMGWQDSHLHQFMIGEARYASRDPEVDLWWEDDELLDGRTVRLGKVVAGVGSTFLYEYDFGDSWMHRLEVLDVSPPERALQYALCLAGERACPPEDCGGIGGYEALLEAISDPEHEEHDSWLEWVVEGLEPEVFELDPVNRRLRMVN